MVQAPFRQAAPAATLPRMILRPKSLLPRGLYGRAALILIAPVIVIQIVVSVAFIQRHFEGVTRQMTEGVARDVLLIQAQGSLGEAVRIGEALDVRVMPAGEVPGTDGLTPWDLTGRVVAATFAEEVPGLRRAAFADGPRRVTLFLDGPAGPLAVEVPRRRVSASNPHQLLVWMIATSVLMTLIAFYFLRAQLRPITRLAAAAEAFGKGQIVPYRSRGALEVRAAGRAFLDMRARIERQIEQRTLMLSGVSHDLRTPLTRLRLGLAMLPEDDEVRALQTDVAQMQRMVDEFLAFARGDATEEAVATDVAALVREIGEACVRVGQNVTLGPIAAVGEVMIRREAVRRAVENLLGNAVRYGTRVTLSLNAAPRHLDIAVEDDGPGIPPERREEAVAPFARLDAARDLSGGTGSGLGLAIAADVARSHGGELRLSDSADLGGLKAELVLAR
jgi:two-component system osmolarity sensor histidine kinase EnvZ